MSTRPPARKAACRVGCSYSPNSCAGRPSVLNEAPTCVQNHRSVTLTENILIPESEASKPLDRGEARAPRRGRNQGSCAAPREEGGREWVPRGGGGAPQQTRPPALAAVCSFALCILCQNRNRNKHKPAGQFSSRRCPPPPGLCVPMIDARALATVRSVQRLPA